MVVHTEKTTGNEGSEAQLRLLVYAALTRQWNVNNGSLSGLRFWCSCPLLSTWVRLMFLLWPQRYLWCHDPLSFDVISHSKCRGCKWLGCVCILFHKQKFNLLLTFLWAPSCRQLLSSAPPPPPILVFLCKFHWLADLIQSSYCGQLQTHLPLLVFFLSIIDVLIQNETAWQPETLNWMSIQINAPLFIITLHYSPQQSFDCFDHDLLLHGFPFTVMKSKDISGAVD